MDLPHKPVFVDLKTGCTYYSGGGDLITAERLCEMRLSVSWEECKEKSLIGTIKLRHFDTLFNVLDLLKHGNICYKIS